MKKKEALDRDIEGLGKKLGVAVPQGSPSEQIRDFVKQLDETSKKCQAKIATIAHRNRSSRRKNSSAKPGDEIIFNISCETTQAGIVKLLKGFEEMDRPIVVTSIDLKGSEKKPDQVKVLLELYTYIFDGRKP